MDCWTLLQLPEEADERTIKRTYARLLKSCRPDDDAEGFQRLREAYEEALAYSRWRADWEEEDTTVQAPVAEQAYGNLNDLAELMDVSALHPAPFETPQADPAHTLLSGLNASNFRERWVLSIQQDCTDAFQTGLLRHCFDKPSERVEIASWAVQHLEWLTPWQQVAMTPWQHDTLTSELLQEYRNTLHNLLEQKDERAFINQLTQYSNQPWLRVFDLQQQWQRIVLQLLHDSHWSVPLFERVCQAFGWDDQKGVFPEPAWMWRELVSRCEQESFFANLQAKAQEMRHPPADAQAARLLLTPMSASQQKRMIDGFGENEWNACQHLSEVLTWRYPQLLERLPNPDAFFWRKFVPRPIYTQVLIRLWGVFALGFLLSLIKPQPEVLDARSIILFLLLALVPAGIGFRVTQFWASISSSFRVPDLWLSQHLIPKRLNPNQYWLVIRHGLPQAIMLVACGLMAGVLGMVTYAGALLINLLHTKRIGQISHKFSQGYPWLNGLHWAFWSPMQAAFLVVMVAVIIAAQHYLPAVPWTHFDPPKP
ncbi:J domain-containing protein [Pseudomonas syringae]|uniref:J domain-containing protein n=1 Tax=Pseudomonas syringae TaxID=317 RepID=UPI001F1B2393|nr:J domain-containing protein [Pseudomonas syringae]MCF5725178.1 J domain-containing protein [Pseudomonas syringae]